MTLVLSVLPCSESVHNDCRVGDNDDDVVDDATTAAVAVAAAVVVDVMKTILELLLGSAIRASRLFLRHRAADKEEATGFLAAALDDDKVEADDDADDSVVER